MVARAGEGFGVPGLLPGLTFRLEDGTRSGPW